MAEHNELGRWGEQIATEYLISKGYTIADRNWKSARWELDIVAFKGDRVVFVEVKTRSDHAVDPIGAIDSKRINHLVRAANSYVLSRKVPHEIQFDVIIVIGHPMSSIPPEVEHIPDAFFAPLRTIK